MENEDYTIFCSKCGAEMRSSARYCLKCGALNYDHEANKNMQQYIPKNQKTTYEIGGGKFIAGAPANNNKVRMSIGTQTGNKALCFFINYGLYLLSLVVSFLATTDGIFDLEMILSSLFPFYAVFLSLLFFYLYAAELILMKCNKKWWIALIPFYNAYVLTEAVFQKKWLGILNFIPGINIIFWFVLLYKLGEAFQYKGWLTVLLAAVFIPMMGFGTRTFRGFIFVDDEKLALEKDYKRRKIFYFSVILVGLLGICGIIFGHMSTLEKQTAVASDLYYVHAAKKITSKIQKEINNNNVVCRYDPYTREKGIYYFQFEDLGKVIHLPFYSMRKTIHASIRMDNTSGSSKFYISLGDGEKGFPEVDLDQLTYEKVTLYIDGLPNIPQDQNVCKFGE